MKSDLQTRTLKMLADAYLSRVDLPVNPEYQRGTVWSLSQKQGLIDSLLRGYQIPLFYVHLVSRSNPLRAQSRQQLQLLMGSNALPPLRHTCRMSSLSSTHSKLHLEQLFPSTHRACRLGAGRNSQN